MDGASWGGVRGTRHERGYGSAWDKLRVRILERDMYLCQECKRQGRLTPLAVKPYDHAVDHIQAKAFGGSDHPSNLESLCSACHDAKSKKEANDTWSRRKPAYDEAGFPVWDDHTRRWGYSIPDNVKPSGIPVMLVSGPPAAGKSTYIEANAKPGDTVIDFDLICEAIGGRKWEARPEIISKAFKMRDGAIHSLHRKTQGTCYLIVTAPTDAERRAWKQALGNVTLHLLRTPQDVCIARIKADPNRADAAERQIQAVKDWWSAN